jgi:polyisoprenoid-binding protein YceI
MTTAAVTTATRSTWAIDPAHTSVEFAVKHLMISTVRGRFSDLSGTVELDDQNPAGSTVEVRIDVASIDTRQADRDAHLRSADFFDVEHFPTMRFMSTRIVRDGDALRVEGDLTIRGVTRPVALRVTEEGRTQDPWGNERVGYSASTRINRRDFGLTWNQALETGGFVVGDEVKISADVEVVRQQS